MNIFYCRTVAMLCRSSWKIDITIFCFAYIMCDIFPSHVFTQQEIEEDKKKAEQEGIAVTTPRKPRPHDAEPDRRKTEKENITVTVDLSRQTAVGHHVDSLVFKNFDHPITVNGNPHHQCHIFYKNILNILLTLFFE